MSIDLKVYYIKEVHLKLFYDFVEKLDKIPDTNSKITFLKSALYRPVKLVPFRIIVKHFVDRILEGEAPKVRVLPLTTEPSDNKTTYQLNLPQLDLLISKGLNNTKFRQKVEDWIYSTKGITQRFICDYANCENIFKIPKTDLREMILTPRLRIDNCKVLDLKTLSENFVGYNKQYLANIDAVPKDYVEKKGELLPSYRAVQVFTARFLRNRELKKGIKSSKKYDMRINEGIGSSYSYRFPAMVFTTNQTDSPLYYYIKRNDLTHTNLKGMYLQEIMFLVRNFTNVAIAGYFRNDTIYLIVCNFKEYNVRAMLEGKASKFASNPTTYMDGYNDLVKRVEERSKKYKTKISFKVQRMKMTPLMDIEAMLNFLLMNKDKARENLAIMFTNNVVISPYHIIIPSVVLEYNNMTGYAKVQTLDEKKETYRVHRERISGKPKDINSYVGRTVHLFLFEIGGNFLLMEKYKEFTLENHEYEKNSIVKYTKY